MEGLGRILWVGWLLAGAAHALYLDQAVTAFPVAEGAITVDGKPENIWREISTRPGAISHIAFNDYRKIVLLEPVEVRNAPPEQHFQAPPTGSVTLLAAYDRTALYFFFLVRENNTFDPRTLCTAADLWKAHAVDVYVDPNVWSETLYTAYFSADADEASYGTSPKTLQVAKPTWPGETRRYYRDRKVGNRFELRTAPAQLVTTSSTRTPTDLATYGVEIKVPMATAGDIEAGKSMFISWGYNHYPVGQGAGCGSLPIAYRFAKHYKTYDADPKPPGWIAGDNTHFDPLRSYDGWGRFELNSTQNVTGGNCRLPMADTTWDLNSWYASCGTTATSLRPLRAVRSPGEAVATWEPLSRDLRGRLTPQAGSGFFILPGAAPFSRFGSP